MLPCGRAYAVEACQQIKSIGAAIGERYRHPIFIFQNFFHRHAGSHFYAGAFGRTQQNLMQP
jgi:hypothetical protein